MLHAAINKDDMTVLPLKEAVENKASGYSCNIRGFNIRSAFQPIISIPHRRAVGYEGLVRAKDNTQGKNVSPADLFKSSRNSIEQLALDRACRCLHIQNFSQLDTTNEWLFINLDSQCLASEQPHPGFMDNLFSLSGIKPNRVVIEILEHEISDREYLHTLIHHFRSMGCLIAIDDFGAGHSNFDRIWELEPDIVKLDRKLIQQAAESSKLKRIFKGIVSLIHGAGSLVVIEGVETREEALVAIEANADMVQGFYFSRPEEEVKHDPNLGDRITDLLRSQQQIAQSQTYELNVHFSRFKRLFEVAIDMFVTTHDFEWCTKVLFSEERTVRCFLLDSKGEQIGKSIEPPNYQECLSDKFAPLLSGENANWSQKHYHHRAMRKLDKLQVTRPYLSLAGLHLCVTVSMAKRIKGEVLVFCCDLDWQDG